MAEVDFYSLTPNQYSSLETKDNDALYFLTNGEIYKGDTLLSNNIVIIPDSENYPETGKDNTLYAKLNGESAFWNGSSYTLISHSIIAELQLLENRIDVSINSIFNVNKLIDRTITEINSEDIIGVGSYAFQDCTGLTSINLPNVTNIGSYAFQDCTGLTSINLPNVTNIGSYAFKDCTGLTSINLPNVTTISSSSFRNCTSLTSISSTNFPNLTDIGNDSFNGCTGLTSINLPNVTNIGSYAFNGCTGLTSINLPNVTSIGVNVFNGCRNLITVNLPNATDVGNNTFRNCSSLVSISLPSVTSISGAGAFFSCTSLTTIVLSKNQVATLSNANAFNSTPIKTGTGYIYVPDDLVDSYKAATNWKTYKNQIKGISELPSNNGGE